MKAVVIFLQNKIDTKLFLFFKRSMKKKILPGVWSLPSETQEEGEDIYETAIRGLKEVLSINIARNNVEYVDTYVRTNVGEEKTIYIVKVVNYDGEIIKNTWEFDESKWLTIENFYQLYTDDQMGHVLQYLRNKWQTLELLNPKINN